MVEPDIAVFRLERGRAALEKYAAVNHLTVRVYGPDLQTVGPPVNRTPLFDVFTDGHGPGMFAVCARQCLTQTGPGPPVIVEEQYGLAVVGTPLRLAGTIVGAAVAGYALTSHPSYREVERLARDCRLPFNDVWSITRKELPVPTSWLLVRGELLGILCNTLLSEDHRARQLEETSLRLAEASEAKDRFLAALSHELRTPLTAILGYAAILRNGRLDEAATRDALAVIERNGKLQAQLIEDLLDVSRIVSGSVRLDRQPLAPGPVVEAAVTNTRLVAHARQVSLDVTLDPDVPTISGDPARLEQIVSNLLANAIKFTPAGGTVDVRVERTDDGMDIVVRDTGTGIDPDFLPYVFDRFRQADTTDTRTHGGLGLGLAIVRHLVTLHGGTVRAESPGKGGGATFTVSLPTLAGGAAATAVRGLPAALPSPGRHEIATLDGLRVLVVDDDTDARALFTSALEDAGARVTAVESAAAAVAALRRIKPDVLVSDIGMPGETGYVLMRRIRRLPAEQGGAIPALAVTAYAGDGDLAAARAAGFQAHLAKPVQPTDLALAVAELARAVRSGEP